jgi:Lar family restriction alleviation protein
MSDKLKPCPFCGGKAEFRSGSSTMPYIRCRECGGRTKSSRNKANLIAVWNRRAEHD